MQDITIRKRKTIKKKSAKKTWSLSFVHIVIVFTLGVMVATIAHSLQNDHGVRWIHGTGSVKMLQYAQNDHGVIVSAMYNQKPLKQAKMEATRNVESKGSYYFQLIEKYFPEKPHIMYAIAKEESALNPKAVNYNCRYKISQKGKTKTTVYDSLTATYIDTAIVSKERLPGYISTWCRAGHIQYAWSKDSGLFGINSVHTTQQLSPEEQVKMARAIYEKQGLNAWISYKTKRYLKHL